MEEQEEQVNPEPEVPEEEQVYEEEEGKYIIKERKFSHKQDEFYKEKGKKVVYMPKKQKIHVTLETEIPPLPPKHQRHKVPDKKKFDEERNAILEQIKLLGKKKVIRIDYSKSESVMFRAI